MLQELTPYMEQANKELNYDYFKALSLLKQGEEGQRKHAKIVKEHSDKIKGLVNKDNKTIIYFSEYLTTCDMVKDSLFSGSSFVIENNVTLEEVKKEIIKRKYNQTPYYTLKYI